MQSIVTISRVAWVLALAAFSAGSAQAADWYIGASYVQSELETRELDVQFDADDKGFALFAGQDVNRFFALEAAYVDLGSPNAQSMGFLFDSEAKAFSLSLLLNIPMGRKLELIGRGGYAYWDIETRVDDGVIQTSSSDSDYDFTYGAGLRLKITRHLALRANYDRYEIKAADDIQAASLGAEIRF